MNKEQLTRGGRGPVGLPEDVVEVEGVGTVRVRAMNRGEVLNMQSYADKKVSEQYMLSCTLIDPAGMTMEDVADWQAASVAMEIEPVTDKVAHLSGILKDSPKSDVQSDGEQSVD